MKKFSAIFLLTSLSLLRVTAQDQHVIDSLNNQLQKFRSRKSTASISAASIADTMQFRLLNGLAWQYVNTNPDKALEYSRAALSVAKQISLNKFLGDAYNTIGCCHFQKGNFDTAIYYFTLCAAKQDAAGNKDRLAEAYENIGQMHGCKGNYPEQLEYQLKALKIQEEMKDSAAMAGNYVSIGSTYQIQNLLEDASGYFQKGLSMAQQINNKPVQRSALQGLGWVYFQTGKDSAAMERFKEILTIKMSEIGDFADADAYTGIANIYLRKKQYDEAIEYFQKAVDEDRRTRFSSGLAATLMNLGDVYADEKKFNDGLKYYTQALDTVRVLDLKNSIALLSLRIADAYRQLGEFENALRYSNQALATAEQMSSIDLKVNAYSSLVTINEQMKNYKAAYENELMVKQLSDSLYNTESQKKVTQLSMQYEFDKKQEQQKAEQDKKDAMQLAHLSKEESIRNIFIGSFSIFLLLSVFLFIQFRQKQKSSKELAIEKERAERSEKFKQQFLANMSHEIRTPMNAILGMTNLALESSSSEKQKEYLGGIQKSSDTLIHIINDILDVSKIEAGKIEIEKIDFSLREVVEQVKQTLQHKANEKGIQLLTSVEEQIPDVLVGDPVRLNQVLMNLCGNAIKFTERGSVALSVIVRSGATKQSATIHDDAGGLLRPAKSGSRNDDAALTFVVEDTGIGIPKEKLNSIFESFTQAHSSDSRRFGGTGLGLTISKQLIELMGGRLSVESEPGSGSTFSFELNFEIGSEKNLQQRKKSETEIDGSILNGLKILLADDNEYNRIVAIDTLKSKSKVEINAVTNGKEAIEMLRQHDYDVVLMDVQMPEMDGYEATQKIRTEFSSPKNKIPIIALTASVIRSDLDKCKAAGMNGYVPKPFNTSQLIGAIAELTGSNSPSKFPRRRDLTAHEGSLSPSEGVGGGLDLTYLKNFCEGDEARMTKYITMFIDSGPESLSKIEAGLVEENRSEIFKHVHALKPRLQMMGVPNVLGLAAKVERLCNSKTEEFDALRTEANELISMTRLTLAQLRALQSGNHIP